MVDELTEMYPHRCDIEFNAPDQEDEHGQPVEIWSDLATEVPCRFVDKPKMLATARFQTLIDHPVLMLPSLADLSAMDIWADSENISEPSPRMRIKGIYNTENEKAFPGTFTILSVADPGGEGDHLECELEQVS